MAIHGPRKPGGGGASTFVALKDTPIAIQVNGEVVGNAAGDALEFIRRNTSPAGLEIVTTVPPTFRGYVLNLKHPAHVETGDTQDRIIVAKYNADSGFYGYSDGSSYPRTGTLSDPQTGRLISWIGSEVGTLSGSNLRTWEADYIASHSRSWLAGFKSIWLAGNKYALSGAEVYDGGVWLKGIVNGPNALASGNVTFNLVENNNNVYFRQDRVVSSTGGLLWWSGRKYVLLGGDTIRYKGVHSVTEVYYRDNLVISAAGIPYLCVADVASVTTLIELDANGDPYWIPLSKAAQARESIVDVTGQGGHPQITAVNKDQLHADFSIPRLWLPQHIPNPAVPAVGTSALWPIAGKYRGTDDYFPAVANDGDIAYSRAEHVWQRRISASASQTFSLPAITADKSDFPGTYVWLGERDDATDAAAHVPSTYTTLVDFSYLFYNRATRVVEKLSTYVAPTTPGERYAPSRILSYADWLVHQSVKPTVGNPEVNAVNQYEIHVDPSVPRAWIGQRIPYGSKPAKGTSIALKRATDQIFLGSFIADPPSARLGLATNTFGETTFAKSLSIAARNSYQMQQAAWLATYNANRSLAIKIVWSNQVEYQRRNAAGTGWEVIPASYFLTLGQTYYNSALHYWVQFYGGVVNTGVWTPTVPLFAFRQYSGTTYWLGERSSAIEAAAHAVYPKVANGRYIFYNTSTARVEQLNVASMSAPVNAGIRYVPVPLVSFRDREPEVLVDTLGSATDYADVILGSTAWRRRASGAADAKEINQIAFNRQLMPVDDGRLMSIELTWEETDPGSTSVEQERTFMATISAGGFRRFAERIYSGGGANNGNYWGSADWYVRRPNGTADLNAWGEVRLSYGRFRAAYLSTGLGSSNAAARAAAPDGIAFHWGLNTANVNLVTVRKLRARITLHG